MRQCKKLAFKLKVTIKITVAASDRQIFCKFLSAKNINIVKCCAKMKN